MKIPPPGTELEYDPQTYPTFYRFRKELQGFGLQLQSPNEGNAGHYPRMHGDWGPSDPGFRTREQSLKHSLNYNTSEEENKRLERRRDSATRKRDIAIIKQAALEEIQRLESGAAAQSSSEVQGR
jgi:hypothetical protein